MNKVFRNKGPWDRDDVCQAWLDADEVLCDAERDGSMEALLKSMRRRRENMPQGVVDYIGRRAVKICDELYGTGALVEPGDPGRGYQGVISIDNSGITYR